MRSAGIVPVHAVVEYGSPSIADPALSSPYVPGICEGGLSAISTSSEPRSSFVTCIDTAEDSASEPSSNIVSASRLPTRCRSMSPYRDSPAVSHVRAGAGKTMRLRQLERHLGGPPTHPSRTPRTAPRMTLVGMEVDIVRIALCRDARTRSAKVLEGAGGAADHATSRDDLLTAQRTATIAQGIQSAGSTAGCYFYLLYDVFFDDTHKKSLEAMNSWGEMGRFGEISPHFSRSN